MVFSQKLPASDPLIQEIENLPRVTASFLKHHIGETILRAKQGAVAITRHKRPEFILLSVDDFMDLQRSRNAPLNALATEFDAMVERMNTPAASQGVAHLFAATSNELGQAALAAVHQQN